MADEFAPALSALPVPADLVTESCPWPAVYADCEEGGCSAYSKWGEQAEAAQALFEAWATDLLWNWTNRVFGLCPVSYRPCRDDCAGAQPYSTFWGRGPGYDPTFPRWGTGPASGGGPDAGSWIPVLINGAWTNVTCGTCLSDLCSCNLDGCKALQLPGPVNSIDEVLLDGTPLPPSSYRLDYHRTLLRVDGGCWPQCQDLAAAPDQPNTWQVSYTKGLPVPIGGQVALGRLACELAKDACGDESCELPAHLTSMTRQGLTMTYDASLEAAQSGLTGIDSIDKWIGSVTRPKQVPSSVRSPDIRMGRSPYQSRPSRTV